MTAVSCPSHDAGLQGGPKKPGHRLRTIILSKLNRFKKITEKFLGKFAVKGI